MKQRILVVDDDRLVADTLRMIYAANGYESEATYSAAEGWERAQIFAPELVLCDVSMPEENGLSLAAKMTAAMPECKVLLFTAYGFNEARVHVESLRMQRPLKLLAKPCPPEDLLRETRALLGAAA